MTKFHTCPKTFKHKNTKKKTLVKNIYYKQARNTEKFGEDVQTIYNMCLVRLHTVGLLGNNTSIWSMNLTFCHCCHKVNVSVNINTAIMEQNFIHSASHNKYGWINRNLTDKLEVLVLCLSCRSGILVSHLQTFYPQLYLGDAAYTQIDSLDISIGLFISNILQSTAPRKVPAHYIYTGIHILSS